MLVVQDELVLLLAVLGVLTGYADLEVPAEGVEQVVAFLFEAALVVLLGVEVVGRVLGLGLVVPEGCVGVVFPRFWAISALTTHVAHVAHAALTTHVLHLVRRVIEGASARL